MQSPEAPETYSRFIAQFPELGQAWETIAEAGRQGPLEARTQRLLKLAVAMGAMREGAVHASVRKARAMGISQDEILQVVALAAGTMGLPATVALYSWVADSSES